MKEHQMGVPGSNEIELSHPDNLRQMALALDRAWEELPASRRTDETRHELARLIVTLFDGGERDLDRLGERIRSELGIKRAKPETV
jgi:hypothetical protein